MKDVDFIKAELARICWLDGHKEGLNGMLGVAFTIRNRIRNGWYGGQWHEVLSHHREWSAKIEPLPDTIPDPRIHSFMSFLQQVDQIFSGSLEDFVTIKADGEWRTILSTPPPVALYYGYLDQVTNPFFLENISRKPEQHQRIAQVGQLFFFT